MNVPDPVDRNAPTSYDAVVAKALLGWCRAPAAKANRVLLTIAGLTMIWLTVFAWDMPDRAAFLRNVAMMFTITHAAWHFVALHGLKRLQARGIAGASDALGSYTSLRRVSHLDIAAAWLTFALLVRCLEVIHAPL